MNAYPSVGFLFAVEILKESMGGIDGVEAGFLEVSGIVTEMATDKIVEGGENRFVHKVPARISNDSNLVLKRGLIASKDSNFGKWCKEHLSQGLNAVQSGKRIQPKDIIVHLLDIENKERKPKMSWAFFRAYPIKWEISGFNAKESSYMVESISLVYAYAEVLYP